MKIAVLTSGILPVPSVEGGAVENLIDFYLGYNDKHHQHDITIYSIFNPLVKRYQALQSSANHYRYINSNTLFAKIGKRIYRWIHGRSYYHDTIQYYLYRTISQMKKSSFDFIIVENRPGYIPLLSHEFPSTPIVLHLHNDLLNANTPNGKLIYDSTYRIITVSNYISQCVKTIDANSSKCITIYNGIDLNKFSPSNITVSASRSDYGLSDDDFLLVFSGRIIPEKGIKQLIEAMLLLNDYPKIKLMVLGSSFYGNNTYTTDFIQILKKKAEPLGNRLFFTGYIPYEKMPSMLAMADVAVLPSVWDEPFGMTCLEAMSMGLPLITTKKGGIPEIVSPGCGTMLSMSIESDFTIQLANQIIKFYNDRDMLMSMRQQALLNRQRYSKEVYAQSFLNAIS